MLLAFKKSKPKPPQPILLLGGRETAKSEGSAEEGKYPDPKRLQIQWDAMVVDKTYREGSIEIELCREQHSEQHPVNDRVPAAQNQNWGQVSHRKI